VLTQALHPRAGARRPAVAVSSCPVPTEVQSCRPVERSGRPPWAPRACASRRASSVSAPHAPAVGSTSPRTSGSTAGRGCHASSPQRPRSIPRRHQPSRGWPSPSHRHSKPLTWKSRTTCPSVSARSPAPPTTVVDHQRIQGDPSPSLQPHYRTFTATTRRSAPVPRVATQLLGGLPLGVLALAQQHLHQDTNQIGIRARVPTFRAGAQTKLAPPPCRAPPGQ
jgi:hypothetical protein